MPEIPEPIIAFDQADYLTNIDSIIFTINELIKYLEADKKLRDKQYEAVANFAEKTKTLVDEIPMFAGTLEQLEDLSISDRPLNFERE